MALSSGTRLGPYELVAPLGAGGMGEVYRARDTRLDRTVAIKVLPDHLAANPDLRHRFEREARAVSSLNHPHICLLFDVGQQDGIDYLVMEYLEGETLADRLSGGALPPDQVLRFGIEIADALDKAHRQGIVHRDLKPGNVMLTKSGAKLLDFGLAKLQAAPSAPAASVLSAMATGHRPLTEAGAILGTFQYMAPEQLEGKEADARTDLFALGTILYEMATGRRAFSGKSQASLIAAILSADPPPLSSIQPLAPLALERLVKVCLAKDPDDRLQTAHDVMQELKWIAEAISVAGVPAPVAARRRSRERLAWILVGLLPLLASALTLFVTSRRGPVVQPTRFVVPAPEGASSVVYQLLSPDGRNLAFLATVEGLTSIWVRHLDSLEAHPLRGTEGVENDFMWSADSASVAFAAKGRLNRLALSGGPPLTICDAKGDLETGDWSRDGTLLLSSSRDRVIYRVSASGGTPTAITAVEKDAAEAHVYPTFLPDGRHFLYLARRSPLDKSAIYLASLDSPERRLLVLAESQAYYAPPGYLLFVRGATLMAQPFDARGLRVHGEPIPLADDVLFGGGSQYADFSVSANGTLAFRKEGLRAQLTWLDRAGRPLGTIGAPGPYSQPALSPDGASLVVLKEEASRRSNEIWLFDLRRGSSRAVTEPGPYRGPLWSRDGQSILFGAGLLGEPDELRRRAVDGSGSEEVLLKAKGPVQPSDVSPDGRVVAYTGWSGSGDPDILLLPLAGEKRASRLVQTRGAQAQFSPDGRWVAYTGFEGTGPAAFVEPNPPAGGRWQVSGIGGVQPRWRSDGKEIFYLAADGTLMAVDVDPAPSGFKVGQAQALFRAPGGEFGTSLYVVAAGGQRFLFASPSKGGALPPVTVVLNWAAELQR